MKIHMFSHDLKEDTKVMEFCDFLDGQYARHKVLDEIHYKEA